MNDFYQLILYFVLILFLPVVIEYFLLRSFVGVRYRLFVAPGVAVHEFSHALLCLLTGAKIQSMELFKKEGGQVVYTEPKLPSVSNVLISLAPLFIGLTLIYLLAKWLGIADKTSILKFDYTNWLNWLGLYLLISIAVTMTPSKQDLKNIAYMALVVGLLGWLLFQFTNFYQYINTVEFDRILSVLSTVNFVLVVILAVSFVLYLLSRLTRVP